jgi:hypothetical protein
VGGAVSLTEFLALNLNNRDATIGTGGNINLNVTGMSASPAFHLVRPDFSSGSRTSRA